MAIDTIPKALSRSKFRNRFQLEAADRDYLSKRGLNVIELQARDFISRRLAPAKPLNDGKQTPFKGHPVFKAQHATATCCRGCLQKWYRIKKGRPLTPEEREGVVRVLVDWIRRQLAVSWGPIHSGRRSPFFKKW